MNLPLCVSHTHSTLWAELLFRSAFPQPLALVLLVTACAATVWFYRREAVKISWPLRVLLIGLRWASFGLLTLLLLKPVWFTEVKDRKQKPIYILLDNSASMKQRDARPATLDQTRLAIAYDKIAPAANLASEGSYGELAERKPDRKEVLQTIWKNPRLQLPKKLQERGPLVGYMFGLKANGLDGDAESWVEKLTAGETQTSLQATLQTLLKADDADLPAAVVVATDGRDNAGPNNWSDLAKLCRDRQVPLHIYGVGVAGNGVLQLLDANIPDTHVVEDNVRIPVRFRVEDITQAEVEIRLFLENREVARQRFPAKPGVDTIETLSYTPTTKNVSPNRQAFKVQVQLVNRPDLGDSIERFVRVIDRKIKVLFVEGAPRWEFKFLQRAMLRDRRVDSTFWVTEADAKLLESGAPFIKEFPLTRKELFAYDMVYLGDIKPEALSKEQWDWLKDFVSEGGGLVVMAGRQSMPAAYERSALAEMLPVEFNRVDFPEDDGKRPEEYQPKPTDAGERNGLLQLADKPEENRKLWQELPGWFWHYPVKKLKPGAIALLEHDRAKMDNEAMPLIASHYYGKGLVLFLGSDETWRWRMNSAELYFARFWAQVIYQVGLPHIVGSKSAQIRMEQGINSLGTPSRVFARLFNKDFKPLTADKVKATVEKTDAKPGEARTQTLILESVPGQPGEYIATLPNDKLGKYQLKLSEGLTEPAMYDFRVDLPPEHELAPGGLNQDGLKNLAIQSGGAFYREEDLFKLAENIPQLQVERPRRQEVLLWNSWLLGLVVACLSVEWLLRKAGNLS